MTSLLTERPDYAHLSARQYELRQRLAGLRRRLDQIDPSTAPRAYDAIEMAIDQGVHQLESVEAQLIGVEQPTLDPVVTTDQARSVLRGRLMHLLVVTERNAPPECEQAVIALRRAVEIELARLDQPNTRRPKCD